MPARAFATVSYADEQITPEDQSGTQLEKFTVLFNLGDDVEGEAPESMEVEPETSITLPDAEQFSKEGYTFAGWNDGLIHTHPETAIQSIATLFSLLNGRKTREEDHRL